MFKSFGKEDYNSDKIDVLDGLEPVRLRPGMYVGGTDTKALHHLAIEIIDNSIDEVINNYASEVEVNLINETTINISDNGRGIPVDEHPKFKNKSALEIIFTKLHSGGKFDNQNYQTSGGLHGVGASVVNALSKKLSVEVIREKIIYKQEFEKGIPKSKLLQVGKTLKKNGTSVTFSPDPEIFGNNLKFLPEYLFKIIKNKAYLSPGVKIL